MKRALLLMTFFGMAVSSFSADALPFEQQATEAIARGVFENIGQIYSTRKFNPVELVATSENPVRIFFSENTKGTTIISATSNTLVIRGRTTLSANVSMIMDDPNKKTTGTLELWPKPVIPGCVRMLIKSGNYECGGTFKVNGKKIILNNGEAVITGKDVPVKFSEGTQAMIDGKTFTLANGAWVAAAAEASPTPEQ